jgi:hypothetical protein
VKSERLSALDIDPHELQSGMRRPDLGGGLPYHFSPVAFHFSLFMRDNCRCGYIKEDGT